MAFKFLKGFSFVEILIAVAVIVIILVVSAGGLSNFYKDRTLESTTQRVISAINEAKSKTLSSKYSSEYGVHFEQSKAVLFQGTVYNPSDQNNKEYKISEPVEIFNIFLNGGGADLIFKRFSGETAQYGTVSLRLKSNLSKIKIITINPNGIIN